MPFRAGEVHDFPDDFAQKWLRRAAAIVVTDEPEPQKAEETVKAEPARPKDMQPALGSGGAPSPAGEARKVGPDRKS